MATKLFRVRRRRVRRARFAILGAGLIEAMLALAVVTACGASILVATEFSVRRNLATRIESRVGSILREHNDRALYLPYDRLPPDDKSEMETGNLYQPYLPGKGLTQLYPYNVVWVVTRTNAGTEAEYADIILNLTYDRPNPRADGTVTQVVIQRGNIRRRPSDRF